MWIQAMTRGLEKHLCYSQCNEKSLESFEKGTMFDLCFEKITLAFRSGQDTAWKGVLWTSREAFEPSQAKIYQQFRGQQRRNGAGSVSFTA